MQSSPKQRTPDEDPVAFAKAVSGRVLLAMLDIVENGGSRGAGAQATAARLILEVARLTGSKAEDYVPSVDAVKEAAKVIYLVDADKAQELLSAQRKAERKP
jgi:hypothetical protein